MELVVLGLSHRTAPLDLRERLAIVPAELETLLKELVAGKVVREATLISTCNRVEAYAAGQDTAAALDALATVFARRIGGEEEQALASLSPHLYRRSGDEALLHLFRVAASLDSLVVGEPQILGQVKEAFDAAMQAGSVGPFLASCFPRAFRVARRVRRETGIARNTISVSSVAVELARQVFDGFAGRRILLIGAGKMADLAARSLRAQGAEVSVTNRTRSRAEELGRRLGCTVEDFGALDSAFARADVVISSTGARAPIVSRAFIERVQKARRGRPLVIIDIAVPRDVEPGASSVEGVFLWDVDDLQKVADQNMDGRRQEADRAESLVANEVRRFAEARKGQSLGPTITALRARFSGIATAEAEKTLARLGSLDERGRRDVLRLAETIVNKLLHTPQVVLKTEAAGEDGEVLLGAAQRLFDLTVVESVEPDDADDSDEEKPEGAPEPARAELSRGGKS